MSADLVGKANASSQEDAAHNQHHYVHSSSLHSTFMFIFLDNDGTTLYSRLHQGGRMTLGDPSHGIDYAGTEIPGRLKMSCCSRRLVLKTGEACNDVDQRT